MAPITKPKQSTAALSAALTRILEQGYGGSSWHGPNLKDAISDVAPAAAFKRPAAGRHNVAEIALHHAWYARSVASRLTGKKPGAFALDGEDWFEVESSKTLGWDEIRAEVDKHQQVLARTVADVAAGRVASPLSEDERLDLVVGITCHAAYHAGQIQLVKKLI